MYPSRPWRFAALAFLLFGFTGCVGPGEVGRAELRAFDVTNTTLPSGYYSLDDFNDLLKYGVNLTNEYLALSDRAVAYQDLAALGIIGSAGSAAAALVYGPYTDVIAGAGLAAGMISATTSYARPGETSTALLAAAQETNCIVRAGHKTKDLDNDYKAFPSYNALRVEIVLNGFMRAKTTLRTRLKRQLPSYGDLVTQLKESAVVGAQTRGFLAGPQERLKKSIAGLREEVAACALSG